MVRIEHSIRREDISALALLHQRAFPDFFLSRLGTPFLEQFYSGFVDDSTAIIALMRGNGGQPIAIAVGTTEPAGFFRRLLRKRLLGFIRASIGAALRQPSTIPRLLNAVAYRGGPARPENSALLSSICVDPAGQGQGLGAQMLESWAIQALALGQESAYLYTDTYNNDSTNRLYLRAGWRRTQQLSDRRGRVMNMYEVSLSRTPRRDDN